jgi:hypothetical protein
MGVEFVYWCSHELLNRLSLPQRVGRARFWFDARRFDEAWFTARLDEALKAAGPRYTPEIHVDLPIAAEFEAFGRSERFFDRVKACARSIREKLRHVQYSKTEIGAPAADISESGLSAATPGLLGRFGEVGVQACGK